MTNSDTHYEPDVYENYPHTRYRCPCGTSSIAIGYEVEGLVCNNCGSMMNWDENLHMPGYE